MGSEMCIRDRYLLHSMDIGDTAIGFLSMVFAFALSVIFTCIFLGFDNKATVKLAMFSK